MEDIEKLLLGFAFYYLRSVFVNNIVKLKKPKNLKENGDNTTVKHEVTIKNYNSKKAYKVICYILLTLQFFRSGFPRITSSYSDHEHKGIKDILYENVEHDDFNPKLNFTHEQLLAGVF